jgi:hypothetical protein
MRQAAWLTLALLLSLRADARPTPDPEPASRRDAAPASVSSVKRDLVADGQHWRLTTPRGPIHLWRPAGYRSRTAGIVLYLHGYNINVDQAWEIFKLATQFQESRQNALFIVPEAPVGRDDKLKWPSLGALLRTVARGAKLTLPRGHVVAIGHSGAFRTLASWLDYRWLDHLILLDALYANDAEFESWIELDPLKEQRKMVIVAEDTRAKAEAFVKKLRHAASRKGIPSSVSELRKRERRARVLYLDSQYKHNEMVQNGKVIPLLLRTTRLRVL